MEHITSPAGITVSFDQYGSGPPLVLVHGSFSDFRTNWERVKPLLAERFTVYAIARRGRGATDATSGHGVEDESRDVVALIEAVLEPVFLLGHSYGAQVALAAAARVPDRVRKLVLYEPPWPRICRDVLPRLEAVAAGGDWDAFTASFLGDVLPCPARRWANSAHRSCGRRSWRTPRRP
jgi:pimeloyl-ACP methyl ester carboxylesterase